MASNAAEQMLQYLRQAATELPVVLTDEQLAAFAVYYDFLLEYNEKVNLTRNTEPLDVAVKHFADSLSLLQTGWLPPGGRVADIGTGAGFPGIPLAIMRPDLRVVLVDSLRKRTVFLTEAVQKLALVNVTVVWSRAEDLGRNPDFRERFDIVLARAVAELNVLTELCLPLAKPGGAFVAMKGPKAEAELAAAGRAITLLGGGGVAVVSATLPLLAETRTIIRIDKQRPTSAKYPRKAGIPERLPLSAVAK